MKLKMAKRINNEVLMEKIENISKIQNLEFDNIKKELGKFNEHFKKLNGQTEKNTKFRVSQETVNKIVSGGIIVLAALFSGIAIYVFV